MYNFIKQERVEPNKVNVLTRVKNFNEIYNLFDKSHANEQAERCVQCGDPYCHNGCPLGNMIPHWLKTLAENNFDLAFRLSNSTSPFPEIMGRVCPQDRLCEGACTLNDGYGAITIGSIETFISEEGFHQGKELPFPALNKGKKVAIVGSGPAGLSCATFLMRQGISVTMYERAPRAGGLLTYGIPNFKLEKSVIARRVEKLIEGGMVFVPQTTIGVDVNFHDLTTQFDAVFLGIGATRSNQAHIVGENGHNVFSAMDFLTAMQSKLFGEMHDEKYNVKGKKVVVIGGGDTAMDCLRTSIREGATSVQCLYRRDAKNMPGSKKEFKNADEEGAEFLFNVAPVSIKTDSNNNVSGIRLIKTALSEKDSNGRQKVIDVAGSEFDIEADVVIMALGFSPEAPSFLQENGINLTPWGGIIVDADYQTTCKGVFAGGDCYRGADLVVRAALDGRQAAMAISKTLLG